MTATIINLHRPFVIPPAEQSARAFDGGGNVARQSQDFSPDEDSPTGPLPVIFFVAAMCLIVGVIARVSGFSGQTSAMIGWLGGGAVSLSAIVITHLWSRK